MKRITIKKAIDLIYDQATLPSQIDYVSPADRQKVRDAENYIKTLTPKSQKRIHGHINRLIEEYYNEIPDMGGHSPASLAELF